MNLLNLNLAGTQMTALNIQPLTELHNLDLSNSRIAELKAAKADRYTNGYNWSWQSAKLDLTEGTSEGQLMAGMQITLQLRKFQMNWPRSPASWQKVR